MRKLRTLLRLSPRFLQNKNFSMYQSTCAKINDFIGHKSSAISKDEQIVRCKLASLYRLVHFNGWTEDVLNHITVRLRNNDVINNDDKSDLMLINAFGFQYDEVTASNLVKVRIEDGTIVDPGSLHSDNFTVGVNYPGMVIHTAVHQARSDINCILHFHQPHVQAVASLKCGLLNISLESCILGNISRHKFQGITAYDEEKQELKRSLGPVNKILLLDNHGVVICGETIEETWQLTTLLVHAAKSQLKAMQAVGGDLDKLILIDEEVRDRTYKTAWSCNISGHDVTESTGSNKTTRNWKFGERLFKAEVRHLEKMGLVTGLASNE